MTAKCLFRVNLSGFEAECSVTGTHVVHRYRGRDGTRYEFEIVDPLRSQVQAAREATADPGDNGVLGVASLDTPEG